LARSFGTNKSQKLVNQSLAFSTIYARRNIKFLLSTRKSHIVWSGCDTINFSCGKVGVFCAVLEFTFEQKPLENISGRCTRSIDIKAFNTTIPHGPENHYLQRQRLEIQAI
jgi:hypothetical protein